MRKLRTIAQLTGAGCLLATAACLAPEKGDADITIDKTGGYTFSYHGSMAYLLGLAAKASGKPVAPKDVRGINQALADLGKDKEFLKVTPAGFSRVTVDYKAVRKAGQPFAFIGDARMITVLPNLKEHTLRIQSAAITPKDATQLRQIGYDPAINVTIRSELPVAAQNGMLSPAMLFGQDSYHWKINYNQRAPIDMTVKLPR